MLKLIRISFRNLFRNRRRSLFTIGAIAMGFAAVNIFGGFTIRPYEIIRRVPSSYC